MAAPGLVLAKAIVAAMYASTITVTGMSCGHCADAVRAEITKLPGVNSVDVDVESGKVQLVSDSELQLAALRTAVEEAGYELAGPTAGIRLP